MTEKVYCENCKYRRVISTCKSPNAFKNSLNSPIYDFSKDGNCRTTNMNNNCKFYQKKSFWDKMKVWR